MTGLLPWLPIALMVAACVALNLATRHAARRLRSPLLLPATLHRCDCVCVHGVLIDPCPAHDPAAEPPVDQWAAEIAEEDR